MVQKENPIEEYKFVLESESLGFRETLLLEGFDAFEVQSPFNLLYQFSSFSQGGTKQTITSKRKDSSMITITFDGVNENKSTLNNFDYRLNHYLR